MKNVVLIDLEKNPVQAGILRTYIENDQSVYLFNLAGRFDYPLEEMTELAGWISSGLVTILDAPKISNKEFEYAVIAGQLMALIEPEGVIELIAKSSTIQILSDILQAAGRQVCLTQHNSPQKPAYRLPGIQAFREKPVLRQVKKYCDALGKMETLPVTLEALQNSIANVLKLPADEMPQFLGMLVSLKIIRRNTARISFRKKILSQWVNFELKSLEHDSNQPALKHPSVQKSAPVTGMPQVVVGDMETIMQFLQQQQAPSDDPFPPSLDELQWQVLQRLDELQHERPQDIFSLRDLLHDWFPKADIQTLLKSLVDKGYLQLHDDQLHYSAQMVIH